MLGYSIDSVCILYVLLVYIRFLSVRVVNVFCETEGSVISYGSTCGCPLIRCRGGSQLDYPFGEVYIFIFGSKKLRVVSLPLSCDASHIFFSALVYSIFLDFFMSRLLCLFR